MRLKSLDGLRGVAALTVAIGHLEATELASAGLSEFATYYFVDFFFVLSGFVIALAYGREIVDGRDAAAFVLRRVGRVWPVHVFAMLLFVGAEAAKLGMYIAADVPEIPLPFNGKQEAGMILPMLFMLHGLGIDDQLRWNFPSWSVAAEFWVYIGFAVVMLVMSSLPRQRLAVYALVAGLSVWLIATRAPNGLDSTYDYGLARAAYGFCLGALAEAVWRNRLLRWMRGSFLELVLTGAVIAGMILLPNTRAELGLPVLFALLTFVLASEKGVVSRALKWRVPQVLGNWSYSIYMLHAFVLLGLLPAMVPIADAFFHPLPWLNNLIGLALYLAMVLGGAYALNRYVEEPGRRLFGRLADHVSRGRKRYGELEIILPEHFTRALEHRPR